MKVIKLKILLSICTVIFYLGISNASVFAFNSYNRDAAVNYANQYAEEPNPEYYNYIDEGGDCTNFISQCLYEGGISATSTWSSSTGAWRDATLFRYYLMDNDYCYRSYTVGGAIDNWDIIYFHLSPGDVIQYGPSPELTTHSQIVTNYSPSDDSVYIAQHSDTTSGFYKNKNLLSYLYGRSRNDIMYIHEIKASK